MQQKEVSNKEEKTMLFGLCTVVVATKIRVGIAIVEAVKETLEETKEEA